MDNLLDFRTRNLREPVRPVEEWLLLLSGVGFRWSNEPSCACASPALEEADQPACSYGIIHLIGSVIVTTVIFALWLWLGQA